MQNGGMYMAMLAYRSTPLENGLSPAELLIGTKSLEQLATKSQTPKQISTVSERKPTARETERELQ